jgi:hypothetical protein
VGEFVGEVTGELLIGLLCLALFAGAVAATAWGWAHSPVGTVGGYAAASAFLGYGIVVLWRTRRRGGPRAPRRRIGAAAAATVVVVAGWLTYVIQYANF